MSTSIISLKATAFSGAPSLDRSGEEASRTSRCAAPALRFTRDGDAPLERHLSRVCDQVGRGVRAIVPAAKLEGVLLAGGYGRGEGGVLATSEGDRPYNDMEFYVFVRGSTVLNDRRFKRALHELGERLSPEAGLEVEFKILSLRGLRRAPVSMFSHDFVVGHRWVIGDKSLLAACDHHRNATVIPAHEATRLMFNRCTGLLFAAERLRRASFTAEDADFVGRNLAKAQLGIGDALLAAAGRYHWSCTGRHEHLRKWHAEPGSSGTSRHGAVQRLVQDAVAGPRVISAHEAGVAFKLHPHRSRQTQHALATEHKELVMLAWEAWRNLEEGRLDASFASPRDYAASRVSKCPEQPPLRNVLVNVKTFGPFAAAAAKPWRYPRERLFHALALLLWSDIKDPQVISAVQRELRTRAADFSGLVSAYEQLWHHFN